MRIEAEATADRRVPPGASLDEVRGIAAGCTACALHRHATQTVFGEGPRRSRVMLIGEQPGDAEDLEGRPFVGPAGKLLDKALSDAGIDRRKVYVTNVVKHFKWIVRGKRRLHQKPTVIEIRSCRPWLDAEIGLVAPEIVVCLGATAARTLLGRDIRVTRDRGRAIRVAFAGRAYATVHPSSLLRIPDARRRAHAYEQFVDDVRTALGEMPEIRLDAEN